MNVNISFTKSSDVHLHPATVSWMNPQTPGGSFLLSMQMPWLKQTGTNIQIDLRHLHKICGSPPETVVGFQMLVLWLRSVTYQHWEFPSTKLHLGLCPWINHHNSTSLPLQKPEIWVMIIFSFAINNKETLDKWLPGVKTPNPQFTI